ncbi:hypothetical protein HY993_01955, partial [Candidatus Micrarchaeota archaeon]|nr:hypothetical protein [Candidatus Micrarchaeota archaeon]
NPQIEVSEVAVPSLDAKLMAEKVGKTIEIKGNAKQAIRMGLKEIMSAGALGAEVICGGKIVGKGGKAKTIKVRDGYLKKSGHSMKLVKKAKYTAYTKAGAIGVVVKILLPGAVFEDQVKIDTILAKQASNEVKDAAKAEADALKQAAEPKVEEKAEEKPVEKKKTARKPPARKKKIEGKAEEKPSEKKAVEKTEEKPAEKTEENPVENNAEEKTESQ